MENAFVVSNGTEKEVNVPYELADIRRQVIEKIITGKQVNIVIIGASGVGKSSLLSTLQICLYGTDKRNGDVLPSNTLTKRVRKHKLCTEGGAEYGSDKGPYLFDTPGLPDENSDEVRYLLKSLMSGRMGDGDRFDPKAVGFDRGAQNNERDRIDRLIFVHSSVKSVPLELIDAVNEVCNELDIIRFSVLTEHRDQEFVCTGKELSLSIGTHGSPRCFDVDLEAIKKLRWADPGGGHGTNQCCKLLLLLRALLNPNYPIHSRYPTETI